MQPAARLLLLEADSLCAILDRIPSSAFDHPTVCTGWSVRDVREALGEEGAYASAGIDIALDLLLERSARMQKVPLTVHLAGMVRQFGAPGEPVGEVRTDIQTFVRLCGGRRPDPDRYRITGAAPADMVLFS